MSKDRCMTDEQVKKMLKPGQWHKVPRRLRIRVVIPKSDARTRELCEKFSVAPRSPMQSVNRLCRYTPESMGAINLTKKVAQEHLMLPTGVWERDLDEGWVEKLRVEIRKERFMWAEVNLVTADIAGVRYRINGQHTCWARDYEFKDDAFGPEVRTTHFVLCNEQEAREVYTMFDQGRARSPHVKVFARLLGTEAFPLSIFSPQALGRMVDGYRLWQWPDREGRRLIDASILSEHMLRHHVQTSQHVVGVLGRVGNLKVKHLWRPPTVAAMYATFEVNPREAQSFWTRVRDGLDFRNAREPAYKLREYLLTHCTGNVKDAGISKVLVEAEDMYRVCLYMWNAHRRGEDYWGNPKVPRVENRPAVHK